jgi:hypothetical protein
MADETDDRRARDQRARDEDEAVTEAAWRETGNVRLIAMRVAELPDAPAWVKKALFDLADASLDIKPYAKAARRLVRYVAVREAHDRHGLSWEKAKAWAAERLRGEPAEAEPDMMWADYKAVRKALRDAGCVRDDDDPGYRWVDLPGKSPG